MQSFEIEGGVTLHGEVRLSGAKNAALPIMAAALLTQGKLKLRRVPHLRDIETMMRVLRKLGVAAEWLGTDTVELQSQDESSAIAPYALVKEMRASICVLGPLLARRGWARVALPGGCAIGTRPIDLHLKGMRALGAEVTIEHGDVIGDAPKLHGNEVYLGGPNGSTVLGTTNVLCAATLASGTTVIEDAACEPEVTELAHLLNRMGARVGGIGTKRLIVEGVQELHGTDFELPPDRIEAGTFMVGAAMTRGNVLLRDARREDLGAIIDSLRNIGAEVIQEPDGIRVIGPDRLQAIDLTTGAFPSMPTDMQAQFMALLCLADGISVVTERIFPDRFMHIAELNRMRANIRKEGASAIIVGADYLSGAPVMASDLRASAGLVLAGMVARGKTAISRIYHIDRGYERIEEKLSSLGAKIHRLQDKTPETGFYEAVG
jgi:UDP-N-acetylglucosamine 1-carboxyvinyltransferase